jgi:hypothetical protein
MEYLLTRRGSEYNRIIHAETDFEVILKANGIFTKSHDIVDVVKENGERFVLKKGLFNDKLIFFDDNNIVKSRLEKAFMEIYNEH